MKQQHIQHKMKEKLEYASLQTITFKKSEFKWVKKNKEIIIAGQLFDVKSIAIKKDEIIVTGLFDDDENKLEQVFSSVMHQKKNETTPILKLILKFILTPAFTRNYAAYTAWLIETPISLFGHYDEALTSQSYTITTPPPIS